MTPEQEQELFAFMGRVDARLDDLVEVKKDVAKLKNDFSNLKGKLVVVAGIVTMALNWVWGLVKGAF
jgi:hypothetical protein